MPRLDGTGPFGHGTRSGRGLGPCCGYWGWQGRRVISRKEEKELLKEEEEMLEKELEAVRERLQDQE